MPERGWQCLRVLLARGMFARFVRVAVEWRLGNFGFAVSQLERVVTTLENSLTVQQPHERSEMVLQDLYTLLARLYLYSGHIDGALLLIVRVRKVLGIDRLPALPELDVNTVHLVRASIAAGKLLDGNSLATLVVKTAVLEPPNGRAEQASRRRQAARPGDAKVIPFPRCNPR